MEKLMEVNNKILVQKPIENLKPNKKYEFAVDFTREIDTSNEKYVIRGQAKKSTNSFYIY